MAGAGWARRSVEAALIVGAIAALFLASSFTLFELGMAACLGIGVLGVKLLSGYNGQFSLGHSVFFAIGAYCAAILVDRGVDFYLSLPLAAAVSFAAGFALGWPALRIRGHYLAVVTLILALTAPQILQSTALTPLTGGPEGIGVPVLASPIGALSDGQWWFLMVVVASLAAWGLAIGIVRSRFGRAMQACHDNAAAARAVGINVVAVNTVSFGVSAAFAGLAGALMIGQLGYVSPQSFDLVVAIGLFVALVVTGPRWLGGAFLGGLFLQLMPSFVQGLTSGAGLPKTLTWAIYGSALLIVIYLQVVDWRRLRFGSRAALPPSSRGGGSPLAPEG
jgi:branched-chain amino acid transport system permease protein